MRIEAPLDPDGDPLTIAATTVPERGQVTNGIPAGRVGDRLNVDALTSLTFVPDGARPGPAGTFGYVADDGKGGRASARVALEIAAPDAAPAADPEEVAWQQIRTSMEAADYTAFLRLFGASHHAPQARDQLERLTVAAVKEVAPTPGSDMAASTLPEPPQAACQALRRITSTRPMPGRTRPSPMRTCGPNLRRAETALASWRGGRVFRCSGACREPTGSASPWTMAAWDTSMRHCCA